jgi:hypothetical protein
MAPFLYTLPTNLQWAKTNIPSTMTAAYGLLVTYQTPTNSGEGTGTPAPIISSLHRLLPQQRRPETSAMTFAQRGLLPISGTDGATHAHITCFSCNHMGHYASECPQGERSSSGTTLLQYGYMLAQASAAAGINPAWILLDSHSTYLCLLQPSNVDQHSSESPRFKSCDQWWAPRLCHGW